MHFATFLPDWNSLDSVRRAHSFLEGAALVFFALLVVCEALAHLTDDKKKERRFDKLGILFFAIAVLAEIVAYPYGQRNDKLSADIIGSLTDKAGRASAKADAASDKSDTTDKKADAIQKRLDAASMQLGALEEDVLRQAPRAQLLEWGKDKFIKELKPFKQRVAVVICRQEMETVEQSDFEDSLLRLFGEVNWTRTRKIWAACPFMLADSNNLYFVSNGDFDKGEWIEPDNCRPPDPFNQKGVDPAARALCDILNKLRIRTWAWREKSAPSEQWIIGARASPLLGPEGSPGELALRDPSTIFLLIGSKNPRFRSAQKPSRKRAPPQ